MNTELTPEQIAVLRVLHCFPVLDYAGRGIIMPDALLETARAMRAVIHGGMVEEFLFFQQEPPQDAEGKPSGVFRLTAAGNDTRAGIEIEEIKEAEGQYFEWLQTNDHATMVNGSIVTSTQFMVLRYMAEAGGNVFFTAERPDLLKAAEELEGKGYTKRLVAGYPGFNLTPEGRLRELQEQYAWNQFLYLLGQRKTKGWQT